VGSKIVRKAAVGERIRLAGVTVVIVLVVVASTASRRVDRARHRVTVDVVGDSLVTQAAVEIDAHLAGAGFAATVVHKPAQDLGSPFVVEQLAGVRARPPDDVLVLATAANDALRHHDRALAVGAEAGAAFAEVVDRAVEPFADRCVVMVNAREETSAVYHPDSARAVNALLLQARGRHPNLVVVDWAGISRTLPHDWFATDQLHFGPDPRVPSLSSESARAYAAAIVEGVRRCLR
jgi:hypothetical protein